MADTLTTERATGDYARGALFGLAAVSIWAGNIVVGGLGLRSSLTPWDITAIRYGVAGVFLLPLLMRRGLALERLGWPGVAALVLGGAPPVILVNAGLLFAPAPQAGALFPGVMPLMVAGLAVALGMETFTRRKRLGCVLVAAGVLVMVWGSGGAIGAAQNIGHLLFLAAALAFAGYTVAMRRGRLDGLHAAAISAVGSMLLYLPIYAVVAGAGIFAAPTGAIALQAVVQGLLTAVVSYVVYGRAIAILGASSGAAFAASSPAMTALMAIPILDQWPTMLDWFAITFISIGVYVVSGGPLLIRPHLDAAIRAAPIAAERRDIAKLQCGRPGYRDSSNKTGIVVRSQQRR